MRWALLGFALIMAGAARAQEPSEAEAIKLLAKHGIKFYREDDRMNAQIRVANGEALKALDLLRHVKGITGVNMEITDAKFVKGSVDALKYTPSVKGMGIDAKRGLAEADFDVLAKLDKLESLQLFGNEVTAKQLQVLHDLTKKKRLNSLYIKTAKFPQRDLEKLKGAFPERRFTLYHLPTIHFMDPLPIVPDESLEAKLKKQKLNAAIADIVANLREYNGFMGEDRMLHNLRSAALDLDDAALRSKIIDDYVFIAEQRYKYVKHVIDRDRERSGADESLLHRFEYEYADAQLTQLRLKKQAEGKSK